MNPVPVTVTNVPPDAGPEVGLRPVTVGAYANTSAGDVGDVPPAAVTVTSTAPVPAGLSARIRVLLSTKSLDAGVVPKSTAVTPVNPVPVIVTNVPPAAGPKVGLKPVTVVGVIRSSSSSSSGRQRRRRRKRRYAGVHSARKAEAAGATATSVALYAVGESTLFSDSKKM